MSPLINTSDDETDKAILAALEACYGRLDEPNFGKICERLQETPYRHMIETLRASGIDIRDTTDFNNDVSLQLVLDQSGDQVGLALSGVGRFAAILHQDSPQNYSWVTRSEEAPTPLAATAARTVEREGFKLLDRAVVSRRVAMNWYDFSTEVTLYQALFSDK